jgi:GT2 family glycosyltransferase
MNYAAFIITYKRTEILLNTIKLLLSQSLPPKKVLIIDNDPGLSAKSLKNIFRDNNIEYFPVGKNVGPAGAAHIGLTILSSEGWQWILWMDDDDPPSSKNQIECIFSILNLYNNKDIIGVIGASGVYFDLRTCLISRIPNHSLNGVVEVDNIAGNQFAIYNKNVIDAGLLPNEKIFFGFEELEYQLRIKDNGYKLLVNADEVLRLRKHFNRDIQNNFGHKKRKKSALWRKYYSTRTLTFISNKYNNKGKNFKFILNQFLFSFFAFRYGFVYGYLNVYYTLKGLYDGIFQRFGLRVNPILKTN